MPDGKVYFTKTDLPTWKSRKWQMEAV